MKPSRLPAPSRLQIRVAIYILVIAVLFLVRGGVDWDRLADRYFPSAPGETTLRIAGSDLAPVLLARLAEHYRGEYPHVTPLLEPGGTNHALESVLAGQGHVAFLTRPPRRSEQELCREVRGDTLLWYPVAIGGLVLLSGAGSAPDTLDLGELRSPANGSPPVSGRYLLAPDPNLGIWDAFVEAIHIPADSLALPVTFLADPAEVLEAVSRLPGSLGVASTLSFPADSLPSGVRGSPLRPAGTEPAVAPDLESISSGDYPLFHRLYVAVPARGSREGAKFTTFVASAHGQRVVERAGCIPARYVLREIQLTGPRAGGSG